MAYIGNTGGKLAGGSAAIKYVDTTSMTLNWIGNSWIFSIANISIELNRLINQGYCVHLQLCRKIVGKTRVRRKGIHGYTNTKYKYPTLLGRQSFGSVSGNFDITSAIKTTPASINCTSFINNLFTYGNVFHGKLSNTAVAYHFTNEGYWYQYYSFCLVVYNIEFAHTNEYKICSHFQPGQDEVIIDHSMTDFDGEEIHLYPL